MYSWRQSFQLHGHQSVLLVSMYVVLDTAGYTASLPPPRVTIFVSYSCAIDRGADQSALETTQNFAWEFLGHVFWQRDVLGKTWK